MPRDGSFVCGTNRSQGAFRLRAFAWPLAKTSRKARASRMQQIAGTLATFDFGFIISPALKTRLVNGLRAQSRAVAF
jgi:hypothetical protein